MDQKTNQKRSIGRALRYSLSIGVGGSNPSGRTKKEKSLMLKSGHRVLRENTTVFKNALMSQSIFNSFIVEITHRLPKSLSPTNQARLLATLFEVNVRDTTRIGEPLFETLKYDLRSKASGEFEFIPGDKSLAQALLQLINQEGGVTKLLQDLCEAQTRAGIATPFDYRRLTVGFTGEFAKARVQNWIDYFQNVSPNELRNHIEIGRSFASTKAQRYSSKEEELLCRCLKRPRNLLDIGGSTGINAQHIMNQFDICTATVTDIRTEEELKETFYGRFEKSPQIKYILGDRGDIVRSTPDNEKYDLVTVNNVLIHIVDKEAALNNILPRLDSNGILVIKDGYNANPPRIGFWIFQVLDGRISLVENL